MSTRTLFLEILNTVLPFVLLFFLGVGDWSRAMDAAIIMGMAQLIGMVSYVVDFQGGVLSFRTLSLEAANTLLPVLVGVSVFRRIDEMAVSGCGVLFALQVLSLWSALKD